MKLLLISAGSLLGLLITASLGVTLHMYLRASLPVDREMLAKRQYLVDTAREIYAETSNSPCAFLANSVTVKNVGSPTTGSRDYNDFKRTRAYLGYGLMLRGQNYCLERLAAGPAETADCLNGDMSEKAQLFCLFGIEPRRYDGWREEQISSLAHG